MPEPVTSRPVLLQAAVIALLTALAIGAPAAGEQKTSNPRKVIEVDSSGLHTLTFSKIIYQPENRSEIAVLQEEFSLWILESLKKAGYNVVGFENLVFDVDKSNTARMILGGTIEKLKMYRQKSKGPALCEMVITWQVFDRERDEVVYEVQTRYRRMVQFAERWAAGNIKYLILGCLKSLCTRERFVSTLSLEAPPASPAAASAARTTGTIERCGSEKRSLPADMESAISAVVNIRQGNAGGAGFFVTNDGLILTAAHVVEGPGEVTVRTRGGVSLPAKKLRVDRKSDVAILRFPGSTEHCLPISEETPGVGEELFAVGAPLGEKDDPSVSKGVVSGIREKDGISYIQTNASLSPGNSGGPLLNTDGEVVGVSQFKVTGLAVEGLGFAITASRALEQLTLEVGDRTEVEPDPISSDDEAGEVVAGYVDEPDPPFEPFKERLIKEEKKRKVANAPDRIATMGHIFFWTTGPLLTVTVTVTVLLMRQDHTPLATAAFIGVNTLLALGTVAGVILWTSAHKLRKKQEAGENRTSFLVAPAIARGAGGLSLTMTF